MKYIKNIWAAPGLILLCCLSSCKNAPQSSAKTYSETSGESFKEGEFSPWMSKADQQVAYDGREEGTYFAYIEGRCEGGFQQFRHVVKREPKETYSLWGVYWGLSATEFYQVDLKLQREGFTRSNLQVFEDGTGAAFHQAVWVKKK
jgi:hypothetical protein